MNEKLHVDVSREGVETRRRMLLERAASEEVNLNAESPKAEFPKILAKLATGTETPAQLEYVGGKGAAFDGQDSMFGKSALAGILSRFRDRLPDDVVDGIREHMTRFPHFLDGGTENHVTMKRAAGLLFGERFPDATFHHGLTGRELAATCRRYVFDYGRRVFASSLYEYLSPVYWAVNLRPWLHLRDCAQDEDVRRAAQAMADWLTADLAANTHHGVSLPPFLRDRGMLLAGRAKLSARELSMAQSVAWLYWGKGELSAMPDDAIVLAIEPEILVSDYVPHEAIRNLGAKRVALPYALRQARASKRFLEPAYVNEHGYTALRGVPEFGSDTARNHFRCVYVDRDYGLGTGNFLENIYDPQHRTNVTFGAVWRGAARDNALVVGHPYYYPKKDVAPWGGPSAEDMWLGTSPYQRTVHAENAAVVLFDIPEIDLYKGTEFRSGAPIMKPVDPLEHPLQACFVYFTETVDERVQTEAGFFLRDGEVYVAIRPLAEGATWQTSKMDGFDRIDLPGAVTGCAIEMGCAREHGTFEAFQDAVASASLDVSALETRKEVRYRSTRGRKLRIRHVQKGWLPDAWIDGEKVDFDTWPICESPYVTSTDGVLKVSDGTRGFQIDWRGELPVRMTAEAENFLITASDD